MKRLSSSLFAVILLMVCLTGCQSAQTVNYADAVHRHEKLITLSAAVATQVALINIEDAADRRNVATILDDAATAIREAVGSENASLERAYALAYEHIEQADPRYVPVLNLVLLTSQDLIEATIDEFFANQPENNQVQATRTLVAAVADGVRLGANVFRASPTSMMNNLESEATATGHDTGLLQRRLTMIASTSQAIR